MLKTQDGKTEVGCPQGNFLVTSRQLLFDSFPDTCLCRG